MAFRVYCGIASLAILVLCVVNYWKELTPTWKGYQREYYALLAEKIEDPAKAAQAAQTPPKFTQIYNQELGVADRCTICHLGIDNPLMDGAENPYKVHPGNLLASHSYQAIGCTICHEGQGLATTLADAHGSVPHWDRPLLTGDFVQASCTKCHHEDEIPQAPVLTSGKHLLHELGCVGCHRTPEPADAEKVGPRLAVIGSKVSRKWLDKWLVNPKGYLPRGKMPRFNIRPQAAIALAGFLMTFKDKAIDGMPEPKGDHDAGQDILKRYMCDDCHVTRDDPQGNPEGRGGRIGPDLRKVGNKVNKRWLVAFFENPHAFYPHTKMPRYNFTARQAADLAEYISEEWVDLDLQDAEKKEPNPPPDTPETIHEGRLLYGELGCAGCHDLDGEKTEPIGPDLTFIGGKPVHDLDFGEAKVKRTLPDFLFAKLKAPRSLASPFRLHQGEDPALSIWRNLQPRAVFSGSASLPEGADGDRLAWILAKLQEQGVLDRGQTLPEGPVEVQAAWLVGALNDAGALNPLKMPDFLLPSADDEALTIALMSFTAEGISSRVYEVPRKRKVIFDPQDDFGALEERYRCLSCHSIRGSGDPRACDITFEGSRVNGEWLYDFLKRPYSMRRTGMAEVAPHTYMAMPIFNFPDAEARLLSDYMAQVFVDRRIGSVWKRDHEKADAARGKALFDANGCIACHQLHDKGGDVGPSFTTQNGGTPRGTWVGDKLRGEWIFQYLKDPQALVPDTPEPNLGLSDQEALDLTAYLLSLKNPEFQKKK